MNSRFQVRHRIIDTLRAARKRGLALAASPIELCALLDEVDCLQLASQAADNITAFTVFGLEEPRTVLQAALQTWKT